GRGMREDHEPPPTHPAPDPPRGGTVAASSPPARSWRDGTRVSVIHAIDEPSAWLGETAVEATVGQLEVVVVAGDRGVGPPLGGDAPWAGCADHPAAEARTTHERRLAAIEEHLEWLRRGPPPRGRTAAGRRRPGTTRG